MARRLVVIVAAVALFATACGSDDSPVAVGSGSSTSSSLDSTSTTTTTSTTTQQPGDPRQATLDDARDRWEAAGITDYEMTYEVVCFCPRAVYTVTVEGGEVVDAGAESEPGSPSGAHAARTVEILFDEIQDAIERDAVQIDVTYDPETGRVTQYWIDFDRMIADEEFGITVTGFTPDGENEGPPGTR